MRISDWSSDVCSSDLAVEFFLTLAISATFFLSLGAETFTIATVGLLLGGVIAAPFGAKLAKHVSPKILLLAVGIVLTLTSLFGLASVIGFIGRSEEHTSELQSLMRISYAVFCLKKTKD